MTTWGLVINYGAGEDLGGRKGCASHRVLDAKANQRTVNGLVSRHDSEKKMKHKPILEDNR